MMAKTSTLYTSRLRIELGLRNRQYARDHAHVESYGSFPVIVYAPEDSGHGNFFDPAYAAIMARPEWGRRFDKVHAQGRSLPKTARRWRELDSSMSSDALLMNVFCTPGVADSSAVQRMLGAESGAAPEFGWKARVPLASGRFDRTEVDLRWGGLLVEAKLTEADFQTRDTATVEGYRDFDTVFQRDRLPRVQPIARPSPFPPDFDEEVTAEVRLAGEPRYAGYQLIRNVLAAHAAGCSFCVIHDERRPDLREAWYQVMAAVRQAELRVRLKVLTWQELAPLLPKRLQDFLDVKYGIVAPGKVASPVNGLDEVE
jgi:hypothetical protein